MLLSPQKSGLIMFQRLFSLPLEHQESFFIFGSRGTGKTAWLKEHLKSYDHVYLDLLENSLFRLLFAYPEKIVTLIPSHFTDGKKLFVLFR